VFTYRVTLGNNHGIVILPETCKFTIDGHVSNSRVPEHGIQRESHIKATGFAGSSAIVIADGIESHLCNEFLMPCIYTGHDKPGIGYESEIVSVPPNEPIAVQLRLDHHHMIYGNYDPLLGIRDITITIGSIVFRDRVVLNREYYLAQSRSMLPIPPTDRLDTHHFVSPPDSLYLAVHEPGHQYYRYPEQLVRHGTKMRLSFRYLIAVGTEGECLVRIAQYSDTPTSWRILPRAGFEQTLKTVGRWTKVERVFHTDTDATTLALDFRIAQSNILGELTADVGEMWIDDVILEPVGYPTRTVNP